MHGTYDPLLVAVSVLISIFAAYIALDLASSILVARGRARHAWLAGGSLAMGVGIWSMHFVGMLAFSLPGISIAYDVPLLVLSVVVAIAASAIGLVVVSRPQLQLFPLAYAGLAMGAAICGMHYIGIWSMRLAAEIVWDRLLVAASVAIAAVAAFAAFGLAFRLRSRPEHRAAFFRLAGGVVMGAAISGMHYTAMLAMTFTPAAAPLPVQEGDVLATDGLAVAVTLTTILILGIALTGSIMDRALIRRASIAEEAERRARAEAALHAAARALGDAASIQEVVQLVTDDAVTSIAASGAYLERTVPPEPGGEVEVVAVSGTGAPPLGTRAAYPGSLTDEIVARGEPMAPVRARSIGASMVPHLRARCRRCSVLLIPLLPENRVIGAFVLLRKADAPPFGPAEIAYARALSALASAALRRLLLLDQLRETTETLEAIIQASPLGIMGADRDRNIVLWNPAAERIFGWSEKEAMGRPIPVVPDEDAALRQHLREYGATLRGELVTGMEVRRHRKDGTPVDISLSTAPVRDARGEVRGAVAVVQDITERKRAEEERARLLERARAARDLAERRAREEAALRKAAHAVAATYTVQECARQIASSALDATDAAGAFVERIDGEQQELVVVAVAGERVPRVGERLSYPESLARRAVERVEPQLILDLAASKRVTFPGLARACPHCAVLIIPLVEAEEAIGALVLLRRSEQKPFRPTEIERAGTFGQLATLAFRRVSLLEDSEKKRDELARIMASRERLTRGFSHDVKNPLGAADGYLQLLEEGVVGGLTAPQIENIRNTRRSIGSALDIIDALIEIARAEAGRIRIARVLTDVRSVAREIAEEYRAAAEAKGIATRVDLPADLPPIESDPDRIRQILGNLMSNAVKYTDRGEVAVRVELRSDGQAPRPGQWIAVDIADTGPGIPHDKLHPIFREFVRAAPEAKAGTGLGLASSRGLARLLGGDITVESEVGRGSTFTLWLPSAAKATLRPPTSGHLP